MVRILVETIQEKNILPLEAEFCEDIIKAAPMHDLGKIGIDDRILKKTGAADRGRICRHADPCIK